MAEERSWADPASAGAPPAVQSVRPPESRRPGRWRTRGPIGWAFWLCIVVVFPATKLMFAIRYRHGERFPTRGPVLLVANHVSILDPLACARLVFDHGRMPHFLAKESVFKGLAGTILRGIAAERVPWANMYEFALTGTVLIVAVYLLVLRRYDLRFLGAFLIGMVVLLLGGATVSFYVEVVPLMDPLKSVWLVIHVFVASLATALFAIACGISITQLLQARPDHRRQLGLVTQPDQRLIHRPARVHFRYA